MYVCAIIGKVKLVGGVDTMVVAVVVVVDAWYRRHDHYHLRFLGIAADTADILNKVNSRLYSDTLGQYRR